MHKRIVMLLLALVISAGALGMAPKSAVAANTCTDVGCNGIFPTIDDVQGYVVVASIVAPGNPAIRVERWYLPLRNTFISSAFTTNGQPALLLPYLKDHANATLNSGGRSVTGSSSAMWYSGSAACAFYGPPNYLFYYICTDGSGGRVPSF